MREHLEEAWRVVRSDWWLKCLLPAFIVTLGGWAAVNLLRGAHVIAGFQAAIALFNVATWVAIFREIREEHRAARAARIERLIDQGMDLLWPPEDRRQWIRLVRDDE